MQSLFLALAIAMSAFPAFAQSVCYPGGPGSTSWDTTNVSIVVIDSGTGANSTQLAAKDTVRLEF